MTEPTNEPKLTIADAESVLFCQCCRKPFGSGDTWIRPSGSTVRCVSCRRHTDRCALDPISLDARLARLEHVLLQHEACQIRALSGPAQRIEYLEERRDTIDNTDYIL